MRIIGGEAGGRRLKAPKGQATRPTADRVKEATFNILGPPTSSCRVLDLFCGSGALALEALSRGAARATLVDKSADALKIAADNAASLGYAARVRTVKDDAARALPRLAAAGESFDWIFVDPPYASGEAQRAVEALGGPQHTLVAGDGVVVVEHDRRTAPPGEHGALALEDRRRYGDTEVSFYRRAA